MNGAHNFLLDTNIVIGFLNGHKKICQFFQKHLYGEHLYISQITRMELLGYPDISQNEESVIQSFLDHSDILPLDDLIADKAIVLRRTTRLKLPDAIIAATAIVHELILVTCDTNLANNSPDVQSLNPINA